MNLNQITPGIDYAYFPYRGKQEEFRWNRQDGNYWRLSKYGVFRVKAIRTYSERELGKTRDTGYVDCFWLDDDGEFRLDENDNHIIKKIPVRHIATIWDDYADELDHQTVIRDNREREREERRARERAEWEEHERQREERLRLEREQRERELREAREREEREKREREIAEQKFFMAIEQKYGLPAGSVQRHSDMNSIVIDEDAIKLDMNGDVHLMKWDTNGETSVR